MIRFTAKRLFCRQNVLNKLEKQSKLLSDQEHFQDHPENFNTSLRFLRDLNRQGLHGQVVKEYDQYIRQRTFPKEQYEKLQQQYDYAQMKTIYNDAKHINLLDQEHSDKSLRTYKFVRNVMAAGLLMGLFYYYKIYNPNLFDSFHSKKEEKQPKKKRSGLFGILSGDDNSPEKDIKTRFSDVLGIDEFKEELVELVDYLKNPNKYAKAGAKLPKGLLLVGPPGTGKTMLARALAGESQCSFFYKSGAEFDEVFVGVGASRIRKLFKKAREHAPSIIFIDEIDSVGGKRNEMDPSHSRETINQILAEMDGFKPSDNVIVIGATNFEQSLDPAIKRAGRFDKIISVPLPDVRGRQQILAHYMKKIQMEPNVSSDFFGKATSGFSGADLQNLVNIAILNAVKMNRKKATVDDFEYALDRISMGIGRSSLFVSDKDKLNTAYHEGGHALASLLTDGALPLHKVTILPVTCLYSEEVRQVSLGSSLKKMSIA